MATVGQLASCIGSTVDLCGQHEHQRLLKASGHLAMLDAWAGEDVAAALASYKSAFAAATEAKAELERVQEASRASSAQLEEARFIVQRIDEVSPS
ncbi:MAG: DNA repair protein RecN, partial [Eggerthellaceae bacterium]